MAKLKLKESVKVEFKNSLSESDQIIETILTDFDEKKIQVFAPVVRGRKGHYRELFQEIIRDGFLRVRVDGEVKEPIDDFKVDRYKAHDIEIVVDRLVVKPANQKRLNESIETALRFGNGIFKTPF